MQNTYQWLGLGVVLAVAIVIGVFFVRPQSAQAPSVNQTGTTTTTTGLGGDVSVQTTGGNVTIEQVPLSNEPQPSLARQLTFSADLSDEAVAALRSQNTELVAQLKSDPASAGSWMRLGMVRKIAGDYQGAIEVWAYIAKVGPASVNHVAYGNLGDLYMNFLKNSAKAEANYKSAIAINPKVIDYYRALYTLYHYITKDDVKAAAILAAGLKANPNNADLLALEAELQSGK